MELFVNADEITDSEIHNFAAVSGLSFVIFKYTKFNNIITPDICSSNSYDNDTGLICADDIDLFNIMESSFENVTLDAMRHVISSNNILNHMILNGNFTDIILADKARVIYMTDFEEMILEGTTFESVSYSQLNGQFALYLEQSERTRKVIIRDSKFNQFDSGLAEI